MSQLKPTGLTAKATWLGINTDAADLTTAATESIDVDYGGFVGDNHHGVTRASCVRVKQQYAEGTEIRNTRQISALCSDELEKIANIMGIDSINPEWVGANLILSGFKQFSKIPPSSRLIFKGGVSLVVDMENAPCRYPGDIITQHHPDHGYKFSKSAADMRGVTLWVEKPGCIKKGESAELHVPPVVTWQQ